MKIAMFLKMKYIVDNLLLNKCSLNVWNKLLKKMKLNWKIF